MPDLIDQPTLAPTRKLKSAIIAGALATATVQIIDAYFPGVGTALSSTITAGATAIVMVLAAYFTRNAA